MSGHQNALRPHRSIGPMVHDTYVNVGRGFTRRTAKKLENSLAGRNDRAYPAAIAGPPITPCRRHRRTAPAPTQLRVLAGSARWHMSRPPSTTPRREADRVVTAAALLMAVTFASLMAAEVSIVCVLGVEVTLAVLVDATLVRMLLVPAFMRVLGRVNWWAPAAPARLHRYRHL